MSEKILDALTNLFGIITKQDGGATEVERSFVINYFIEQLDQDSVKKYVKTYDKIADFGNKGPERISVAESVRIQKYCKQINQDLTKGQKVVILIKLLELIASDGKFSEQRREIINTVASSFNIENQDYKVFEKFVLQEDPTQLEFENILLISHDYKPANEDAVYYKQVQELNGFIAFLWVSSVEMYFVKYEGGESLMLNGSTMKAKQIYLYTNGSSIKTPIGDAFYFSDITDIFLDRLRTGKLTFAARNIEFKFPNGAIGLRDISLSESQGKLVGIMGGSGAGKTTLLNVLSGIEKPSRGQVIINGFDIFKDKDKVEGVIGYVAQDDLLIEELTVYQNLYYNAKLCFKNLTETELENLVMTVLRSLGLDHIAALKVGNVLNKKISGGQRKRLNIALELIREPAVMFVDEPTSGLSSRDSVNVIDLLKELSLKGKLIFVVIHQPSIDIYRMFDKMLLLDKGGYPVYYGDPIEAISYFKRAVNQIEGDRSTYAPDQIFNIIEDQVVNEYGQYTGKRKLTPEQWNERFLEGFKYEEIEMANEQPPSSLSRPSIAIQAVIFTIRDFLSKVSNTQYLLINLLEAPVLALLLAYVIRFQNNPEKEGEYVYMYNDNIPAYILICIIIAMFMGLTVSAEEIIRDKKIQKRERFLNLSRFSYLFSKIVILFLLSAVQTFSFVLIGNAILSIKGELINYWAVLFSISCFANVLGLNISSTFNSVVTIYITIPLLLIPQMILSGLIFKYDKMNMDISTKGTVPLLADFMVSRWGFEAITVKQYKENYYQEDYYKLDKEKSFYLFKEKFWAPELRKKVDNVLINKEKKKNDSIQKVIDKSLLVLRNEIKSETQYKKYLKGVDIDKDFTEKRFNQEVADKVTTYLDSVGKDALKKMKDLDKKRNKKVDEMEKTIKNYDQVQKAYFNQELERLLKREEAWLDKGVVEVNGRLVQRIDPIFSETKHNAAWWDYRADFLVPDKQILGLKIDTYLFNLLVIWKLTFLLFITLYFDFFKRITNIFDKLKFRQDD